MNSTRKGWACLVAMLFALFIFGCKKRTAQAGDKGQAAPKAPAQMADPGDAPPAMIETGAPAEQPLAAKSSVTISGPDGTVLYKMSCKGDKCKLTDNGGTLLASVKDKGEKKKVYGADEKEILSLKKKDYGYKVSNADDKEIYKLKLYPEGDIKLKDAEGKTLFKIKRKGNGYAIDDANGEIARARPKGDKVVVEDKAGKEIMTIQGLPLISATVMAIEGLDIKERLGLQLAIRDMGHVKQ